MYRHVSRECGKSPTPVKKGRSHAGFQTDGHGVQRHQTFHGGAGNCLHDTEIAGALSLARERGRETLRELVGLDVPGVWLAEGSD